MGSICFPHISVICYWNCYCCWFESPKTCVTATATTTMSGTDLFYNHSNFQSSTQWFFFFSPLFIYLHFIIARPFLLTQIICAWVYERFSVCSPVCVTFICRQVFDILFLIASGFTLILFVILFAYSKDFPRISNNLKWQKYKKRLNYFHWHAMYILCSIHKINSKQKVIYWEKTLLLSMSHS